MPKATKAVARKGWVVPEIEEPEEGDQIVSYSELSTYRDCPLKHLIGYRERWSKDPGEDSPLTKGSLWHAVMEIHYTILRDNPGAVGLILAEEVIRALLFDEQNEQSKNQALIWWMYQGYVQRYGSDPQWEILGVEVKFQRRLHGPKGPSRFILKGKLDLVVRDRRTGKIWIIDHKSGANLPSEMELDVDDQFGLYQWLLRESGVAVIGVIHNAARTTQNAGDLPENQDEDGVPLKASMKKQTSEQRMHRTLMNRGDRELDAIARDAWSVACNAYPEKAGGQTIPVYSNPDPRSCGWKCDFLDAHLMARKGRDLRTALKEMGFEQRFERH